MSSGRGSFYAKAAQNLTLKGILPCTTQPFRLRLQEELQPTWFSYIHTTQLKPP